MRMKNDSAAKVRMASLEDLLGVREPVSKQGVVTGVGIPDALRGHEGTGNGGERNQE